MGCTPSSTFDELSRPRTITGLHLWSAFGSHGQSGIVWRGSWYWKVQTRRCGGYFSRWCYRRFFSFCRIYGWWPPAWAGPWGFPAYCGSTDYGTETMVASKWQLRVPPLQGGDSGALFGRVVGVHPEET